MKYTSILFLLPLFLFTGCDKKEEQKEKLDFTEEERDYTAETTRKNVDHIRLTDITRASGIEFDHVNGAFGQKWMPETIGSGGGFLDYNNDGWTDVFLVNGSYWPGQGPDGTSPSPALYRNNGNGTFTDVSSSAGLNFSVYGMGCSIADFDADGDQDIYITAVGTNVLLENDNGVFHDVAVQMGVTGNDPETDNSPSWSTGAAWVDVDRDGWLDLFVDNYVQWTPETDIYTTRDGKTKSYATPEIYQGETCRLYRNIRGQRFEDITEESGVFNREGKSLGVAIADFNDDNWPDIVVSNDTQPNFLYINKGNGSFENKAIVYGIGYDENGRARAGMGVDIADVANDRKLAIAIGNFSQEPLSLYTQTGDALFQDRAGAAQLTRASLLQLTFGIHFADLDNDGYVELITANGHIEPEINGVQQNITFEQSPQVFYNDRGRFIEISDRVGESFKKPIVGRGVATADIDRDGDLDLLLTVNGGAPKLFRNDSESANKSITILLKGKRPNLNAVGAKISVWKDGSRQFRMLNTGSSYLSQSDVSRVVIGLGAHQKADSIVITWPGSGNKTVMMNVLAGSTSTIIEEQ